MNPEVKEIKEIVRTAQEKVKKANESIKNLPPTNHMPTILANR
jgi:hypothetical protein